MYKEIDERLWAKKRPLTEILRTQFWVPVRVSKQDSEKIREEGG